MATSDRIMRHPSMAKDQIAWLKFRELARSFFPADPVITVWKSIFQS
ncbi:MAG: hypothetical protein AAFV95_24065 [Bacteroidota bacterium]